MKEEGSFFRRDALREELAENEANRKTVQEKQRRIDQELQIPVETCPEQSKQFF